MNSVKHFNLSEELLIKIDKSESSIQALVYLLNEGADINYQAEQDGYTPLMLAVDQDNELIVTFLLEQGANPLIKNHYNEIASDIALCYSPIYQLLKNNELLFAALINDINCCKDALFSGANINYQGVGGYTAEMISKEQNHLGLLSVLRSFK
ncbi:ankyrin repeat domain-containing protein [uncultured Legionella sp.]|uniref:ankyrin repeat domain-containing protein n=1 Tax=uncultured Legionella sp. TaxID=210934 RepID=UPI002618B706|nr:ankyrin repeat domain-containing protein [uncultured Legionella sp.]